MRYWLTADQVDTIRDALYKRVESMEENIKTMTDIATNLRAGHPVPPFVMGENGARVADGMVQNFERQMAKCRALLDGKFAYPEEDDDE